MLHVMECLLCNGRCTVISLRHGKEITSVDISALAYFVDIAYGGLIRFFI